VELAGWPIAEVSIFIELLPGASQPPTHAQGTRPTLIDSGRREFWLRSLETPFKGDLDASRRSSLAFALARNPPPALPT
jgi:hypothetical protein